MPTDMGYGPNSPAAPRGITPAHAPALILTAVLIVAIVFGLIGGEIGEKTFQQPVPSPSDPITIP